MKTVSVRSPLLALAAILLGAGPALAQSIVSTITLSSSNNTLIEGGATQQVTATIRGTNSVAVTITMNITSSTLEAGDLGLQNTLRTFVFPAGTGTRTSSFGIWANHDNPEDTDDETFTFTSTLTPSNQGTPPLPLMVTIDDDEPAATELELVVTPNPVNEGSVATVTARITRGTATTGPTTVTVSTAAGTAETGDWTQRGTTLTIPAGGAGTTSPGSVTIVAVSDADTDDETVTVSGTPTGGGAGTLFRPGHPANETLTITDASNQAPSQTPGAPTNLAARAADGAVALTWQAPSGNVTITSWEYEQNGTWAAIPNSGASTTTHRVTGLTNGTEYTFRVRALSAAGNGLASDPVKATPTTPPGAPTNLTATAGDAQVELRWQAPSGSATLARWQVEQNGTWADIANSGPNTTTHRVTGLTNGTEYTFRVRAVNDAGDGQPSNSVKATPMGSMHAPGAPTNLTATAGDAQVTLTWQAGMGTITAWHYEQNGAWTPIPGSGPNTTSFVVTGLTNGTEYTFRVVALHGTSASEPSNTAMATPTGSTTPAPGTPANLAAAAGDGQVTLTWQTPSGTVTAWHYEQNGAWMPIPGSGAGSTSFVVTGLTNGTEYTFRVVALNGTARSEASNTAAATPMAATLPAPGTPTSLTATAGDGRVALAWRTPSGTITAWHYEQNGRWMPIPDSGPGTTAFVVTGLTNGTQYTFRVAALNGTARSEASSTAAATPMAGTTTPTPVPALPLPALGLLAAGLAAAGARAFRRRSGP